MSVRTDQFTDFFRAVHGNDPFPWQARLLRRVLGLEKTNEQHARRAWPEAIALPTASGKTTCIDIAVFALACEAERPADQRTAARRIMFVVDRRVIVDEAFEHARALGAKLWYADLLPRLNDAKSHDARRIKTILKELKEDFLQDELPERDLGILQSVASQLRIVACGERGEPQDYLEPPLTCHQLRGGMYRDDAWARTPTQPCVIASTVDQIGSRLLFRGYGRSFKAWPIHAGLAGNDSLIFLDEAHCANPFFQTMQAVERYRGPEWAQQPLGGPFHFTILSATPPEAVKDVFPFDMDEHGPDLRDCEVLRNRIVASKPVRLVEAAKAKGSKALEELALELVEQAAALVADGRQRIAILVNRVRTAKLVYKLLNEGRKLVEATDARYRSLPPKIRKLLPKEYDAELLTGRMRPIDRDELMSGWKPPDNPPESPRGLLTWFGTSSKRPTMPRPAFVIATQCLEVGANLDFDGMVSECASLDALRQRFGRLKRTGRADCAARGAIVVRTDQTDAKNLDPVYGEAIAHTWTWLQEEAEQVSPDGTKEIDFGIAAMHPRLSGLNENQLAKLVPPAPDAPVMLPAHVDCWVQTSPVPHADPDVAVFLHGPNRGEPEVQICWRADLPQAPFIAFAEGDGDPVARRNLEKQIIEAVSLCPPTTLECLQVPLRLFRRWLRDPDTVADEAANLSDIEGEAIETDAQPNLSRNRVALIWRGPERGPDATHLLSAKTQIRSGDTIVLPEEAGGWDAFGHIPENAQQYIDVGDLCHLRARNRWGVRLNVSIVASWPASDARTELLKFLPPEEREFDWSEVRPLLESLGQTKSGPRWVIEHLGRLPVRTPKVKFHPNRGIVLYSNRRYVPDSVRLSADEWFTQEDETASATVPVPLLKHNEGVGNRAARSVQQSAFARFAETFRNAGTRHDFGKADPRYQVYLHGGSTVRAALAGELYAKSAGLRQEGRDYRNAWKAAQLPDDFRHELLSLQLVTQRPELGALQERMDEELLLHLMSAHHGYCRPFAPVVRDDDPCALDLTPIGIDLQVGGQERLDWPAPHRLGHSRPSSGIGVAERFWRLVRRYGWWGLALLEAIFILADHRQSEAEEVEQSELEPEAQLEDVTS